MQARDFDYMVELAPPQVTWGGDVLDINVGVQGIDELALLEAGKLIAFVVKALICVDTPNHDALVAAGSRWPW